jgi:hypothetical protein
MRTGKDANRPGLYISECCVKELTVMAGQMFPRCPQCSALTEWEPVKKRRQPEAARAEVRHPPAA